MKVESHGDRLSVEMSSDERRVSSVESGIELNESCGRKPVKANAKKRLGQPR